MSKIIRLQESDLMELVQRVLKEQTATTAVPPATPMQNLRADQKSVRQDLRQTQKGARQELRGQQRAQRKDERLEQQALNDILKVRRQIGNLPTTIQNAISRYQQTETFAPFVEQMKYAMEEINVLLQETAAIAASAQQQTPTEG